MFTKDLSPNVLRAKYEQALAVLQASDRTVIGHIDCGVAEHDALGYAGGQAPDYLQIDKGRDFMSADPDAPPITDLKIGSGLKDGLTDYPDHGIKTLSCILSNNGDLIGVAPEAKVVPVRIADGPIFQNNAQRDNMARALRHMLGLDPAPRVISISMGNPGNAGLLQLPFSLFGVSPGFNSETRKLFDEVYEAGIIVVAAAGQVISTVIYPARYGRTIAVGGYSQNKIDHYPADDYDIPGRVDIWAQANGINRAYAKRRTNGAIDRGYAEGEGVDPQDISGTSYATPQVAAAAALWVNTHFHALPAIGSADAWKGVEAFRHALVASADVRGLKVGRPNPVTVNRPCLNIERLLGKAPDLAAVTKKAPAAKFWGNQR